MSVNLPLPLAPPAVAAPSQVPLFMPSPEDLHPALWRAAQLGGQRAPVTASGHDALDAVLPGGGWPHRALTELLLPHPGLGEVRLLAPALAARSAEQGCLMLFDPPADLCAPALAQLGLPVQQLLLVHSRQGSHVRHLLPSADALWALEQTLKSGHAGAVLAWLPARLGTDVLRRLQFAAQSHDGPAFVFRELAAQHKPSVAPLRLLLAAGGFDALTLRVLKRRGPPLVEPVTLVLPPVLIEPQREQALRIAQQRRAGAPHSITAR